MTNKEEKDSQDVFISELLCMSEETFRELLKYQPTLISFSTPMHEDFIVAYFENSGWPVDDDKEDSEE